MSISFAHAIEFCNNEQPQLSLNIVTTAQAAMNSGVIKKGGIDTEKYLHTAKSEY